MTAFEWQESSPLLKAAAPWPVRGNHSAHQVAQCGLCSLTDWEETVDKRDKRKEKAAINWSCLLRNGHKLSRVVFHNLLPCAVANHASERSNEQQYTVEHSLRCAGEQFSLLSIRREILRDGGDVVASIVSASTKTPLAQSDWASGGR
jgi:hypothetical protein